MADETPQPSRLLSWRALYLIVAGALALEIVAFAVFTWMYK